MEQFTASEVRERERFEEWYTTHACNYSRDPIGSRDCSLQWESWKAALAAHSAQAQPPAVSVTVDAVMRVIDGQRRLPYCSIDEKQAFRNELEAALAAKENPNVLGEFSAKGKLPERTYLAANTPTLYDGYYPPYFNVTAISGTSGRLHQVELTVRQPTLQDLPPGETTVVVVAERNTALDWKEFVKCVNEADKKFDTIDYSDSCF